MPTSAFPNPNPGGGATWGAITGTLSAQTDLQTALDAKVAAASPTITTPTILTSTRTWTSTPDTALTTDVNVFIDASGGAKVQNLLNPTTAANKIVQTFTLIGSSDTNTVTLTTPAGVIGVGGAATWVLVGRGSCLTIVPDGTNYQVLGGQ